MQHNNGNGAQYCGSDKWTELEFVALRQEILALAEAERSSIRFFIPAAAVVYTVPYFLLERLAKPTDQQSAYLWTLCAVVAGMMALAMTHSLLWSVDGARRIGAYIRKALEPRTNGGLRWEGCCFTFHQLTTRWPSEALTISIAAIVANVVAAAGAAFVFLDPINRAWPPAAAAVLAALAIPSLWRIAQSAAARGEYAKQVEEYISAPQKPPEAT
jgi:hypothetical protein